VLDQTWEEAIEAMFEEPELPRLRRTLEQPIVEVDLPEEADHGDESG
jgi:hypothetical protein